MDKVKAFFAKVGPILAWPFKQVWSLVSDRQWDFDPYKVGGFVIYGAAVRLGFGLFDIVEKTLKSGGVEKLSSISGSIGILSGLVGAFITAGTFLFNQARKSDDSLPKDPA